MIRKSDCMISTRQLRYLDAIARYRHFGRAAMACAVTQPALSMQIQQLEAELGTKLVERRANGVSLTSAGIEIALRAGRILVELRDMTALAGQYAGLLASPIRLGLIPTVAPYILPRLLPTLRDQFPGLMLHIRETQTEILISELREGGLDLILVALPLELAGIETLALFDDEFLLAMSPERAFGKTFAAAADLIENDRLLLLEEGHCLRDQALAVCGLRRIENIDLFGASSLSTIVQMVANGLGMTLLPEISIPVETANGRLKLVRFADPAPKRTLGLAWRRTSGRQRDFEALGAIVSDVAST
jgi:LysR family transcriptional regulator, hydrogen peroxide-inducible genes activator